LSPANQVAFFYVRAENHNGFRLTINSHTDSYWVCISYLWCWFQPRTQAL
jgi:hypothetical protein